jgi:hypothetical protein
MRLQFEQQLKLGIVPISEVSFDLSSRHSLVPVLRALQYVFITPELNKQVFAILEKKVKSGIKNTGRYGMSLWEILVLGMVRHSENADFDRLHDMANEHNTLRKILGVGTSDYTKLKDYKLQTIKDNVQQLDEETIRQLADVIVAGAHGLIKKKEVADSLSLQIKADSFVVESNIHFPTDLNLLWDCLRKLLEMISYFQVELPSLKSRSHTKKWLKEVRSAYRTCSEIHRKKGRNYEERLEKGTTCYLQIGLEVVKRAKVLLEKITATQLIDKDLTAKQIARLEDFMYYLQMSEKHLDLVNRRILLKERIPHEEKVFSIFEEHVEWNSKGKSNKKVELGHNVLIATDQYGCILYSEVYESQTDKERTIHLGNKLTEKYASSHKMESISLDRNFYSLPAEKSLQKQFDIVVLPKPGRQSKLELAEAENVNYQNRKRKHACVEGNINQLEHNGLGLCRDKGIEGFKRYVAYGVLAYNAHRLGTILIREEQEKTKRARKKAKRLRAA